jgi:tripartite-type tricarboxylate transporter receptor subunit TctC
MLTGSWNREATLARSCSSPDVPFKGSIMNSVARLQRPFIAAASICFWGACPWPAAHAQPYPTKPVRIVVPFPPTGVADLAARLIGARLTTDWGQQVVVDNRPGATGVIAAEYVAKSAPDGHTLLMGTVSTHAINPVLVKVPFDPVRDFSPISQVAVAPLALAIHPSVPAKSVKDLIALARARPGELNMASFGTGSIGHVAGELFKVLTRTDMLHVPYKGSPVVALVAGEASLCFDALSNVITQANAGKLRILAISSAQRSASIPQIPTVAEAGVPGYEAVTWFGLFGPAGLPDDIALRVSRDIARVVKLPEVRDRLLVQGNEPVSSTPDALAALLRRDIAKWGKLIRDAGIKLD